MRGVAITFAKEGADVAISYLPQEQADAEETKTQVEASYVSGTVLGVTGGNPIF